MIALGSFPGMLDDIMYTVFLESAPLNLSTENTPRLELSVQKTDLSNTVILDGAGTLFGPRIILCLFSPL